jgi:hypothetical protein
MPVICLFKQEYVNAGLAVELKTSKNSGTFQTENKAVAYVRPLRDLPFV